MTDSQDPIARLLADCRTVAVVGLSSNPQRDSHEVAEYLQRHGYRIVPVNPAYAGQEILGEPCHATLAEAATAVEDEGGKIEIVDCFRKSEAIGEIVDDAVAIGARALWMQLGVVNEAAAAKARAAGLEVVMDRCMKIEHMRHAD